MPIEEAYKEDEIRIYPRPKVLERREGSFALRHKTPLLAASPAARPEAGNLSRLVYDAARMQLPVARSSSKAAGIRLEVRSHVDRVEPCVGAYAMDITPGGIDIQAAGPCGLSYAGHTLIDLMSPGGRGLVELPCVRICDWPDFAHRGLMTHVAAAFLSEDELVWRLDLLARNKMNVLHINFADALAFTLPTRRFPGLNDTTDPMTPGAYGVYTRAELRRLVSAAESRHVEIIPGINTPGHGAYWLRQLRCDAPDASETAMCVGNEATYTFLEQLLEEVAPLFPGPHFHIGTDELEFRDRPDVRVSWRTCSHCRRRMAQEGLADTRELFYYFVRRLRNILAGCGKRLVMWNDSVDLARPVDLPPDIRMQFWRVAGPGRGPRRGCSLSKLARTGFEIINSFFPDTYVDVHTRDERLLDWHPHKRPPVPRAFRSRIIGGEACSWRLSDTYPGELYLPPFLAVFGDRLWNRRRIDDPDAFASGLTRHTFGPHTPAELASVHHVDGGHLTRTGNGLFDANPGVLEAPSPRARRQQLTAILEVLGKPSVQRRLMNQPALRALRAHLRDLD